MAAMNMILGFRWVQYLLLATVAVLSGLALSQAIQGRAQELRLKIAQSSLQATEASLRLQTQTLMQLEAEGVLAKDRLNVAHKNSTELSRKYESRIRELMSRPVPAGCEEARIFGLDLAKELTR